jgi:hypothetical protein
MKDGADRGGLGLADGEYSKSMGTRTGSNSSGPLLRGEPTRRSTGHAQQSIRAAVEIDVCKDV